jgi:hypothetical protein
MFTKEFKIILKYLPKINCFRFVLMVKIYLLCLHANNLSKLICVLILSKVKDIIDFRQSFGI